MKLTILLILVLCILGSFAKNNRIIGGTTTTVNKYPYQVVFATQLGDGSFSQFCGGSILSANYILSAAHCFRSFSGSNNVDTPLTNIFALSTSVVSSSIPSNKRFAVQSVSIHPQYSANIATADQVDLCVVRVSTITFDQTTIPVTLARSTDTNLYPPGTTSYVTGFGLTNGALNSGASPSNTMQEVSIPIVTMTACNTALSNSQLSVNYAVVCAGQDGKDSCQGDSGGPLTIITNGYYLQVGVVVFGTVNSKNQVQCGAAGNYGVYASVADFRSSFIEPITGTLPVLGSSGVAFANGTNNFPTQSPTTGNGNGNSSNSLYSLSPLYLLFSFLFIFALNLF